MDRKRKFALFVIFIIISLIVAVLSQYYSFNSYLESFVSLNHSLATLIYTIIFIILAIFFFSITVIISVGSLFFSTSEMLVYSMTAIMISAIVHFYIARNLGKEYVRKKIEERGGKIEKFDKILERESIKTVLILSAIYFVPPLIPNLLGGIMKINLKNYSLAIFAGNLPNTFFTIYLVKGLLYSNISQIYVSIAGLMGITLISLFFYKGQIKDILRLSFPWAFRKKSF